MKLKKHLALNLSSLLLTSLICAPVAADEGKFTIVDQGDPAPFSGTRFDIQATAEIISFKKYIDDRTSEDMR